MNTNKNLGNTAVEACLKLDKLYEDKEELNLDSFPIMVNGYTLVENSPIFDYLGSDNDLEYTDKDFDIYADRELESNDIDSYYTTWYTGHLKKYNYNIDVTTQDVVNFFKSIPTGKYTEQQVNDQSFVYKVIVDDFFDFLTDYYELAAKEQAEEDVEDEDWVADHDDDFDWEEKYYDGPEFDYDLF